MKVLIAGGSGFMGSAFKNHMQSVGHKVWILTRKNRNRPDEFCWDGKTTDGWSECIPDMDAVVNMTGYGLEHWPWTDSQKQRFRDSRVIPGSALVSAIKKSHHRPEVFLQISGINYYGLQGDTIADEWTPPAGDYLARLTIQWEASTKPVEDLGIRRIIARTAVVLDSNRGLFPLVALPVRLFLGGPIAGGQQAMPWIHLTDHTTALRFLLENESASGAFNLISPTLTSNAEFMQAIAEALHRPYWLPTPALLLRIILGEMSTLMLGGRYSQPKRLVELGYQFRYATIKAALRAL